MHLLQGVVNKGANLQTHTPVTSVSNDPLPDGRWLVTTERGSIKAKKVIFATNGYTAGIAPQFKDHIVPVRGICGRIHVPSSGTPSEATNGDGAVTQHASNKQVPHLPNTYSIRYGPGLFNYIVPRNDGSIILGGAKQTWWHEKEHWYNVTDDSTLIEPAIKEFDNVMQKNFIGWEDSGAEVDRIWTGSRFSPWSEYLTKRSCDMLTNLTSLQSWATPTTRCRTLATCPASQVRWSLPASTATACH